MSSQELERQAVEQYQCRSNSSSGSNDGCVVQLLKAVALLEVASAVPVLAICHQLHEYSYFLLPNTPRLGKSLLRNDLKVPPPSGGTECSSRPLRQNNASPIHLCSRGSGVETGGSSSTNKRVVVSLRASQSQRELPRSSLVAASPVSTTCATPSKNRLSAACKSLTSVGLESALVTTASKQAVIFVGAAGDKDGKLLKAGI